MPARVVATLTEEQTRSVAASADGIDSISRRSDSVMPLCTSAENPPMKLMPTVCAARSSASASGVSSVSAQAAATSAIGVTEMRLLMTGMPYSFSIRFPTSTRCSARWVILS